MEREKRYRQKINFIAERIGSIPEEFDNDLKVDAALYRIQTAIESVMDIIAMLTKDKGLEVGDDYSNIHSLEKKGFFDKKLANSLVKLNGLRNAIVHKYNSFEEKNVIEKIEEITNILEKFLEKTENELETRIGKN